VIFCGRSTEVTASEHGAFLAFQCLSLTAIRARQVAKVSATSGSVEPRAMSSAFFPCLRKNFFALTITALPSENVLNSGIRRMFRLCKVDKLQPGLRGAGTLTGRARLCSLATILVR
jgi:hypothetical protein